MRRALPLALALVTFDCGRSSLAEIGRDATPGDGDADLAAGDQGGDSTVHFPAWWDSAWRRRLLVTIDQADGIAVAGLPVLVRIDPVLLPDVVAHPEQVRFVAADGTTVLPHESERNGAASSYWVRVSLPAADTTDIWLYFDNPSAIAADDGPAVFADYAAVWHFADSDLTQLHDSTGHGKTAVATATGVEPTSAAFGQGLRFTGGHVRVASSATDVLATPTTGLTIETLVVRETDDGNGYVDFVGRQYGTSFEDSYSLGLYTGANHRLFFCHVACVYSGDNVIPRDVPKYVVAVRDTGQDTLYVDGAAVSASTPAADVTCDDNDVIISGEENDASTNVTELMFGVIDEVRIAASPRSPDYLAASANNVSGAWLSFGPVETFE